MAKDERSLSEGKTITGKLLPVNENEPVSLGDENTRTDKAGSQQSSDSIQIRDVSDRYKVERLIGQGGMGEVSLALDLKLNRKVAIKRIRGQSVDSQVALRRFMTEAQAIAQLNHYHIVNVYDFGHDQNGPYLILEYVSGGTLADKLKLGPLSLEQSIDMTCQLCDGLAQAHAAGIIHRDIKPANILLTPEGYPKLTDFGLARQELSDSGHTTTGAVIGTIDFMSPEQRRDSSQTDARSDIWSLGATLYQMTTGKSPRIIRFDTVPKSLQEVLGKALEEEKDKRFQSAIEFRDALRGKRVAVVVYDFNEGECPGCLTKNDTTRKFCKKCANSLLALCLSCSESIRVWEEVCDHCGAKQSLLIAKLKEEMSAAQFEAEGLLNNYEFDKALTQAKPLRDQSDPRLTQLNPWAEQFIAKLETERTKSYESLSSSMKRALAFEKTYDYQNALDILNQVHPILRELVISGYNESVNEIHSRLESVTTSVNQLNDSIQKRVESQNLDFLLVEVDQLLVLQPRRKDMIALRNQLLERDHRLKMIRDEAFKKGKVLFLNQDYEGCVNELNRIDLSVTNEEIVTLLKRSERNKERVEALYSEIRQRIKSKQLGGLLIEVNELISLKSDDKHILKLQEQLTGRDLKNSRKAEVIINEAQILRENCQFEKTVSKLDELEPRFKTERIEAIVAECVFLAKLRRESVLKLQATETKEDFNAAILFSRNYVSQLDKYKLKDREFDSYLSRMDYGDCEAEVKTSVYKRMLILMLITPMILMFIMVPSLSFFLNLYSKNDKGNNENTGVSDVGVEKSKSVSSQDSDPVILNLIAEGRNKRNENSNDSDKKVAAEPKMPDRGLAKPDLEIKALGRPTAIVALKVIDGNIIIPLDLYLKEIAGDNENFNHAKNNGVEVKMPAGFSIESNMVIQNLGNYQQNKLWIRKVTSDSINIGIPKELAVSEIGKICFAISNASGVNSVAIQYFAPIALELSRTRPSTSRTSLTGVDEMRFGLNERVSWHNNDLATGIEDLVRRDIVGEKSVSYHSITSDFAISTSSKDTIEILNNMVLSKNRGYLVVVETDYNTNYLRRGKVNPKAMPYEEALLKFTKYSCYFPLSFIEKRVYEDELKSTSALKSPGRRQIMPIIGNDSQKQLERDYEGAYKNGNYLFAPFLVSNVSNEDLYRLITNVIQEFGSARNNTIFARNLLDFMGVPYSNNADALPRLNGLLDLNIDRNRAIQKYLNNSPPGFFVCHSIDLNNFKLGLSGNKNNVVKTVVYSYGQENEMLRTVPTTAERRPPLALKDVLADRPVRHLDNESTPSNKDVNPVVQATSKDWIGTKAGERRTIKVYNIEVPFRWCPPGEFLMGSPNLEKDRDDGVENQSQVTLTKGFWMMETELTQELYQAVIGSNPSTFRGESNLPVENVSWDAAAAFCKKLNQQLVGNFRITLPTEAQWEYACRAGSTTATAFGDSLINDRANFNRNSQRFNEETDKSIMKTTPVASYLSNLWGIYDMHGNVSELCADWFIAKLQGGIDPVGPKNGVFHVSRGGSWNNSGSGCRSARREMVYPSSSYKSRGFRLALISTESKDK